MKRLVLILAVFIVSCPTSDDEVSEENDSIVITNDSWEKATHEVFAGEDRIEGNSTIEINKVDQVLRPQEQIDNGYDYVEFIER